MTVLGMSMRSVLGMSMRSRRLLIGCLLLASHGHHRHIARAEADDGVVINIVGGTEANEGQFPFFVSLDNGCGGSLIAPRVVLTAAHCDKTGSRFIGLTIRIGAWSIYHNAPDGSIKRKVVKQVIHPNYGFPQRRDNDLMLLFLDKSAPSSAIIELSNDLNDIDVGTTLTVIGTGFLLDIGEPNPNPPGTSLLLPDVLQFVEVPVVSDDQCALVYEPEFNPTNMFCAGDPLGGKDSCFNDSGGPIVRYDVDGVPVQTGLVSWGNGCAQPGFPGVYAQIAGPGFTWIHSVLKKDKEEKDKEKDKEKDMPGKRRNIRI